MSRVQWALPVLLIIGPALVLADEAEIRKLCSERWGADYVMQLHCVEEQRAARQRLEQLDEPRSPSASLDGVWTPKNRPAAAYLGAIRLDEDRVVIQNGAIASGAVVLNLPDVRILGNLKWTGLQALPNQLCDGGTPKTLLLVADPSWAGNELKIMFFINSAKNSDQIKQLGEWCDTFTMTRHEGRWDDLVDPSPEAEARRICEGDALVTRTMLECIEAKVALINEIASFRAEPGNEVAWARCVDLLRGRGSMDFNPPELYLRCAESERREEVAEHCFNQHGISKEALLQKSDLWGFTL